MNTQHALQEWFKRNISVDDIIQYEATGCDVHPLLFEHLLDQLESMQRKDQLCLVPSTVFVIYHRNLRKKTSKAA